MRVSDPTSNVLARRPWLIVLLALGMSSAPLLILAVPAALQLPPVEPLLHESEFFPGFSRAALVAMPLAGLVIVNLAIFVATRSLRSVAVAALVSSALAWLLVLGAVGFVNDLNEFLDGVD